MLQKIKSYLGVEGTRLQLQVEESFEVQRGMLKGIVLLESIRREHITGLNLWLEERYTLGRGEQKSIEKFELGRYSQPVDLWIDSNETLSIPFQLRFSERMSKADQYGRAHILARPFIALGKLVASAESAYTLHAEAQIQGTLLTPKASVKLA